jgi:hypothetical protein
MGILLIVAHVPWIGNIPCFYACEDLKHTLFLCEGAMEIRKKMGMWNPPMHRKARSSSSSVSTGKSSHGVQLTCQEYPGNLPSILLTWIQWRNQSNNLCGVFRNQTAKLCCQKSIDSEKLALSKSYIQRPHG